MPAAASTSSSFPSSCDVAIVGAGAAGLATAIFSATRLPGRTIALLDGAARIGAKILVSGGSRCNVTNRQVSAADYWGGDRRVIDAVLRAFPASKTREWFEELGVALHEEEFGKLFPDSNRSRTVLDALLAECGRRGVHLRHPFRVARVEQTSTGFRVHSDGDALDARVVVLATGGLSLPKTGSNGQGLALAGSLGHSLVQTTPALVPLRLDGSWHLPLSGVSHDAAVTVAAEGLKPVRLRGPLLWTHFGISGPAALDASRHWHRALVEGRPCRCTASFLPDADFEAADALLRPRPGRAGTLHVRTLLGQRLPASLTDALLEAVGVDGHSPLSQLSRDARRTLARALVEWDLTVAGSRGYNYAEVTAGGVSLDDIDRHTMASRRCPGLFLVGEMLDVDGRLGGFNFQWAWSSGWVAGRGVERTLARSPNR